jgi:hypothetical protein
MRNQTVLCIAPRRWDALWKETQAIMSRVATDNRVLYVEPGRDAEHGVVSEMIRNAANVLRLTVREARPNLFVIPSPPALPHGRRHLPRAVLELTMPLAIEANASILTAHVRRAMRQFGVDAPILWLSLPYDLPLVGRFREKLVCYYNFDELADFVDNRRVRHLIRRLDDELTRRADIVFATSGAQRERRAAINARTYFVPNAVDFELFHRALTEELPTPDDIAHLPRPILGYAGWLTNHVDVSLLRRIAEAYPRGSLVLVGPDQLPATADRDALYAAPNVVFVGRKAQPELPAYLRAFDVALLPYALTGHVLSAYPTKLHEYLAAGRAVVAPTMPELRPYRDVVRLAASDDEFLRAVGDALTDGSSDREARVAIARANTWDTRVAEIYRRIGPMLEGSRAPASCTSHAP